MLLICYPSSRTLPEWKVPTSSSNEQTVFKLNTNPNSMIMAEMGFQKINGPWRGVRQPLFFRVNSNLYALKYMVFQ